MSSVRDGNRKRGLRRAGFVLAAAAMAATGGSELAEAAKVSLIEFKNGVNSSEILVRGDAPIAFEKTENPADRQVVFELKGAKLSGYSTRKVDTSSFDSPVLLISPYQRDAETARIVVQLRDAAAVEAVADGNSLRISVAKGAAGSLDSPPAGAGETAAPPPVASGAPGSTEEVATASAAVESAPSSGAAASSGAAGNIDQFIDSQKTKRFSGRAITIQARNTDILDVLRLVGEASGFNIVVGEDVKGTITLSLTNVPWDQALDVVLSQQRLGAERSNNLLRVTTLASLQREKTEELAARQAAEAVVQRVTRIFPISYANIGELTILLASFAQSQSGGALTGNASLVRSDSRTNSIIVRDTPDNIERIRRLIQELDTQTPQVLIEGKVIEASESFTRTIGGGLGALFQGSGTRLTFNTSDAALTNVISAPDTSAGGGGLGAALTFGLIPGGLRLPISLSLAEADEQVKTISAPKTVVLNKEVANITESTPILQQVTTISNGTQTITQTTIQANLSLNVTPTVTNDGAVLLDISLQRDTPNAAGTAVANRSIKTKVLVDSGSTLVIGGVYTRSNRETESGPPLLRKIPFIGWLFKKNTRGEENKELFFFITPRILNTREAGLAG